MTFALKMSVVMPPTPEVKNFLQKKLKIKCNCGRVVTGTLIGFDHFLNLALVNVLIEVPDCPKSFAENCVLRGSMIESFSESTD